MGSRGIRLGGSCGWGGRQEPARGQTKDRKRQVERRWVMALVAWETVEEVAGGDETAAMAMAKDEGEGKEDVAVTAAAKTEDEGESKDDAVAIAAAMAEEEAAVMAMAMGEEEGAREEEGKGKVFFFSFRSADLDHP